MASRISSANWRELLNDPAKINEVESSGGGGDNGRIPHDAKWRQAEFLLLFALVSPVITLCDTPTAKPPAPDWPIPAPVAKVISAEQGKNTVEVSQESNRKWIRGEKVCLTRNQTEINCGEVVESKPDKATVKLEPGPPPKSLKQQGKQVSIRIKKHPAPKAGDRVWRQTEYIIYKERTSPPPSINIEVNIASPDKQGVKETTRAPAQTQSPELEKAVVAPVPEPGPKVGAGLGADLGLNYFFPSVRLELGISQALSLGFEGVLGLQKDFARQTILGGYLCATYYFAHKLFSGIFLQPRLGIYTISASDAIGSEATTLPALSGLVGWRGNIAGSRIGVGLGLGFQYLYMKGSARIIAFSGWFPLAATDISYFF